MHLVIDIGNTNIVFGVFEAKKNSAKLKTKFRLVTPKTTTTDELAFNVIQLLNQNEVDKSKIKKSVFCSVVPNLNHNITKMMKLYFGLKIKQVINGFFRKLMIDYRDPSSLGIDRLINLLAATKLFSLPIIVVDLGTATTLDVMDEEKKYLGGMIIPGLAISMEALVEKTSTLPKVELKFPGKLLGNSTKECMQNGIFYANAFGLEGIIDGIKERYFREKSKVTVIITGGLGNFIASGFKGQVEVVSDLTLKGLKFILDEN